MSDKTTITVYPISQKKVTYKGIKFYESNACEDCLFLINFKVSTNFGECARRSWNDLSKPKMRVKGCWRCDAWTAKNDKNINTKFLSSL